MTNLNPVLKQFLNMHVTPERADMLGEIADFLTEIGDDTFTFAVDNILARYDNEDPSATLASINDSLTTVVSDLLQTHGVIVADLDLPYLGAVLRTLMGIPDYGDPAILLEIVDSDATPEVIIAEMTELFSTYDAISVAHVIGEVKFTLIESIRNLLQTNLDSLAVANPTVSEESINQAHAVNEYRNRTRVAMGERKDYVLNALLRQGMPLGLHVDYYIDAARSTIDTLEPEALASELLVLVNASDTSGDAIVETVQQQFDLILANKADIASANVALENLLGVVHD